jgi:hypothetical protein
VRDRSRYGTKATVTPIPTCAGSTVSDVLVNALNVLPMLLDDHNSRNDSTSSRLSGRRVILKSLLSGSLFIVPDHI